MNKIIDLRKVIDFSGFGLKINDDVTVYPTDNAIRLLCAAQMFDNMQNGEGKAGINEINELLHALFTQEDIDKMAGIKGFNLDAMMIVIQSTLEHSMGNGNEDNEVDSNNPND